MKATEHRLGNLIYSPIQKEVVTLVAIEQGNRPITLGEMGTSSFSGFDCLEPILLTEKWLLKMPEWFYNLIRGGYANISIIPNGYIEVKYLHTAQNLYFALIGKELEISRKKEI